MTNAPVACGAITIRSTGVTVCNISTNTLAGLSVAKTIGITINGCTEVLAQTGLNVAAAERACIPVARTGIASRAFTITAAAIEFIECTEDLKRAVSGVKLQDLPHHSNVILVSFESLRP